MLLTKLTKIQNIGKIRNCVFLNPSWNGVFARNTIIYAPNGSGKTTISLIFQSLKNSNALLKKKLPFSSETIENVEQAVEFIVDNRPVRYVKGEWNRHVENVEIFNIHFIEDNLFSGSLQFGLVQRNLFAVIGGAEGDRMKAEIDSLNSIRSSLRTERQRLRGRQGIAPSEMAVSISKIDEEIAPISKMLREKHKALGLFAQERFSHFVEKTNAHLAKFSTPMRLEKISKEMNQKATFYLQFGKNRVTFDERNGARQFKYTLSEGDKNALAFSVFLAKLSFIDNPGEWAIVFDDPLTSLDSNRRLLTTLELARLGERFGQTVILTHDALFAADLEKNIRNSAMSLELISGSDSTRFMPRSHQEQMRTGYFKDLDTIDRFLKCGATNESERREVIRCLRPLLEGFVRFKYYDLLGPTQWLGNFIDMIRAAEPAHVLLRLKNSPTFDDLCLVNDYSKEYHHANPAEQRIDINDEELRFMSQKTLALLKEL